MEVPSTVTRLVEVLASYGASKFYAKKLSPNDTSKNQIYLGGNYSALNIIPFGNISSDDSVRSGSKGPRLKAPLTFEWLTSDGLQPAPNAQLILYPQYPEVRMSGLLKDSQNAPSRVLNLRESGRTLFLGITDAGRILGLVTTGDSNLSKELYARDDWSTQGVFTEIPAVTTLSDSRALLLTALQVIYQQGWIPAQRLNSSGVVIPYPSMNAGGYTLESLLGVSPNGISNPDFLDWEIKQYGVHSRETLRAKNTLTLMTPEPTGGVYRELGFEEFMKRFGYPDQKGAQNRINFGGRYRVGDSSNHLTGLRLILDGFDSKGKKIANIDGGLHLVTTNDDIAASWKFADLLEHWNRKHAKAAYVPSIGRSEPKSFMYGPTVSLGEGTDFGLWLQAINSGSIQYDPASKLIFHPSGTGVSESKRRNQFRLKVSDLHVLYHSFETLVLVNDRMQVIQPTQLHIQT